ncbi:MAG: type II CAAX prenyl endopeptidase Rce1 family protein [Promethearchaeota archaeon]
MKFGRKAAILNVSLWALYHLWAPWTIIANIIIFIPITYLVLKKQDVRLSIFAHMIANFMLVIMIVPLLITI